MEFNKQQLIELLIKKASGFYYTESQLEYEKSSKIPKTALKNMENNNITSKIVEKDLINNDFFSQNLECFRKNLADENKKITKSATKSKTKNLENEKNEIIFKNFDETSQNTAIRAKSLSEPFSKVRDEITKNSLKTDFNDDFLDKKVSNFRNNPVLENQLCMDFSEIDGSSSFQNDKNNSHFCDTVRGQTAKTNDNIELSNDIGNKLSRDTSEIESNDFDRANDVNSIESDRAIIKNSIGELSSDIAGGSEFVDGLSLVKKKVTTHFVAPDMIAIKILFEIFDRKVEENDLDTITDEELMNLKTKLLEEIKNEDN